MGGHERTNDMNVRGRGAMVAYRASDGREMWRWTGDGPSIGASPVICAFAGKDHLVFKTMKQVAGVDPHTGQELWRMPFRPSQDNTIVSPVADGDRLILSDYDFGVKAGSSPGERRLEVTRGLEHARCVDVHELSGAGGGTADGVFSLQEGPAISVDPVRGAVVWVGAPRGGEQAAILAWDATVLVFGDDGFLTAGEVKDRTFRPLGRYRLGNSIAWAHPAVAREVKSGTRLAVYQLPD